MCDNYYKNILNLYYQKKSMLDEILKITKNTIFYGKESDAEKYINFIEKREEILYNIKKIDKDIEKLNIKENLINKDNILKEELENIKNDIFLLIKNIINLDNKNIDTVNKIKNYIKKELKILSDSKNLNNIYNIENRNQEGYYFDIKN